MNILLLLHWMKVDGSAVYYSRLAKKLTERGHGVIVISKGGPLVSYLEKHGVRHFTIKILSLDYTSMFMHLFGLVRSWQHSNVRQSALVSEIVVDLKPSVPEEVTIQRLVRFSMRILRFLLLVVVDMIRLLSVLRRERIDVIDAHSTGAIALAFFCTKLKGTPFVATIANAHFKALPMSMFAPVSRTAKGVIAVSQECVAYLEEGGKWGQDIHIIHNFVDIDRFRPMEGNEISEYVSGLTSRGFQIADHGPKIVVVSRVDEDKEEILVSAIRAMKEVNKDFPEAQLIIAGGGGIFHKLKGAAEEVNLESGRQSVVMIGHESHVEKVLNLADVFIGVGGTVVEAMACGKAVVVAGHVVGKKGGSFGGILTPDNLEELRAFYFTGRNSREKTSPALIAGACKMLLANKAMREDLGQFGRQFILQNCNLDQSVKRIERIYQRAAMQLHGEGRHG